MDKKLIGLDLTHIADGGLQEKLDKELEKVFDNILDLNTEAKSKRKVTITLTMSANEERTVVDTIMEVKSKFAPLVDVKARIPELFFGRFLSPEQFNIMLQSNFIDDNDRGTLLEFASALKIENGAEIEDNGVSQVATVKTGVASLAKGKVPNPVTLRPYRTFGEVEQPASLFVFRIDKQANMALFEADGKRWVADAVGNVVSYLKGQLADQKHITVLA